MSSAYAETLTRGGRLAVCVLVLGSPALAAAAGDCRITTTVPEDIAARQPPATHVEHAAQLGSASPTFGGHGQLLLGREVPRVLYHLPVFMSDAADHPHNFQVVLAVEPVDPDTTAVRRYADVRAAHPDDIFTALPQGFDQRDLEPDEAGVASLDRLAGVDLVHGHFESPPNRLPRRLIADDAELAIERVVYFKALDPVTAPAPTLAYLLFATGDEQHMVHLLSGPPDFDQVLEVAVAGDALDDAALAAGVVVVLDGRANAPAARLMPGETVTCALDADLAPDGDGAAMVKVGVRIEHYCEVGELAHTVTGGVFGKPESCAS